MRLVGARCVADMAATELEVVTMMTGRDGDSTNESAEPNELANEDAAASIREQGPAVGEAKEGASDGGGVALPLTSFIVGGGTPTTASEQQIREEWEDAERRRSELDKMRRLAKVPTEEGGAKLYSFPFETPDLRSLPEAYVVLQMVNRYGEPIYDHGVPVQQRADIKAAADPSFDGELTLLLFCPRCLAKGLPADHCIIHVRQSHRRWHLSPVGSGQVVPFHTGSGVEFYTSAGTIMDSDIIRCAACKWACRIDKNKIWPA